MSDIIIAVDPGLATTGLCAITGRNFDVVTLRTIRTNKNTPDLNRLIDATAKLEEIVEDINLKQYEKIYIGIEDYRIRSLGKRKQEETLKLIGMFIYALNEMMLKHNIIVDLYLLKPGATGWQSKVKKEFNFAQEQKGRGWNPHTRDAYAMCEYILKTKIRGEKWQQKNG